MSYLEKLFGLDGKRALVTGASRGIGKEIALSLAKAGADVAITSLRKDVALYDTANEIKALGRRCVAHFYDIADAEAAKTGVETATRELGGLDILVNNAGIGGPQDVLSLPLETWQKMMDVNLTGAFVTAQHAAAIMSEGGGGSIINITSIGARVALTGSPDYSVSKAGLEMLTKSLAAQLAPKRVRVNAIAPGYIKTDMTKAFTDSREWLDKAIPDTPARRLGVPTDIGGAAIFLASEAAAYVHGHTLVVDGGRTIAIM